MRPGLTNASSSRSVNLPEHLREERTPLYRCVRASLTPRPAGLVGWWPPQLPRTGSSQVIPQSPRQPVYKLQCVMRKWAWWHMQQQSFRWASTSAQSRQKLCRLREVLSRSTACNALSDQGRHCLLLISIFQRANNKCIKYTLTEFNRLV